MYVSGLGQDFFPLPGFNVPLVESEPGTTPQDVWGDFIRRQLEEAARIGAAIRGREQETIQRHPGFAPTGVLQTGMLSGGVGWLLVAMLGFGLIAVVAGQPARRRR